MSVSSRMSGLWRCLRRRSRSTGALMAATAILLAPAVPVAQDNEDFILPEPADFQSDALLMAEVVKVGVEVDFVAPTGIGAENGLQIGAPYSDFADEERVTVTPGDAMGGSKTNSVPPGTKTAASLNFRAAPGQAITILVDEVVTAPGYSLAEFRCNYNAGDDVACDGAGFSEVSVASGTLMVGATVIAEDKRVSAPFDGSFAVTISYQ